MHSDFQPLFIAGFLAIVFAASQSRQRNWLQLPTSKFWELVARADRPVVLLTMRGWVRKRPCYLLPYHGLVFYTWTRPERLPEGASLLTAYEVPA